MSAAVTQRDILMADREAGNYAPRRSKLVEWLLGPKQLPLPPIQSDVQEPLVADEPISDNRLILERLIDDVCRLVGVRLEETEFNRLYEEAVFCLSLEQHFDPEDEGCEYLQKIRTWLEADRLPSTIRKELAELFITISELEEQVSMLSQTRWERLKMWSSRHE